MDEQINTALSKIETALCDMATKAEAERVVNGKVSTDTKAAIDALSLTQRELADRLKTIEQRGGEMNDGGGSKDSLCEQLAKSDAVGAFQRRQVSRASVELKNTLTGSDANVAPDRRPGIVPGAFQPLTIEQLLPSAPTASNAVEYTREASFTNSAAETTEALAKPESAVTWSLVNTPVATVAHWIKISRQLASDNAALAAYIQNRMIYGLSRRVEGQLINGDGVAPNISGILDTGNTTAHGYADAALGTILKKLVLIRKIIADCWVAGYPADAILIGAAEWAQIEIDLLTSASNAVRVGVDALGNPTLFGLPVVQSVGMPADIVAVGAFRQAFTVYNREGVTLDLSESDSDNFTKNLITIRVERRLMLATETPAAVRSGDLTPL